MRHEDDEERDVYQDYPLVMRFLGEVREMAGELQSLQFEVRKLRAFKAEQDRKLDAEVREAQRRTTRMFYAITGQIMPGDTEVDPEGTAAVAFALVEHAACKKAKVSE